MKMKNETIIGIMVTVVLAALTFLTLKSGDFNFRKSGYEIKTLFYNIDGVDFNAPVRLDGMEIGLVSNMRILYDEDDTKMELTLLIDEGIKIPNGSHVYVKSMGLFGEKFVGIGINKGGKGYIQPGTVLVGEEPANWEKMMKDGETIAANLKEISENINERLKVNSASIDEIVANLKTSSAHIDSISANIDERLTINKGHLDDIVSNINMATQNLEELSYDLKLNPWKLMYKKRERKNETMADDE